MTDPRTSRNACAAITLSWVTWCRPCGSLPPCCAGFLTRCRKSWCQTDTPNWRCACMFAGRLAGSRCDWLALVRLAWTIWTYWIYWIYWYIYIWYIEHLWDLANGPQSKLLELELLVAKFINPKTQWKHTTKSTNHKYYKFTKPVPSHGKVMAMLAIGHNQDLLWPGPHKIRTGVHRA